MILGIDQSYTGTGLVVVDLNGNFQLVDKVSTNKEHDIFTRAWTISQYILNFIKIHNITHVSLEGLAFGKFGNATRDLAGLQFIIISQLKFVANINAIAIYSPNTIKKFATSSGKASKDEMINALPPEVKQYFLDKGYKKSKGLADIADAYFIAQYYAHNLKLEAANGVVPVTTTEVACR